MSAIQDVGMSHEGDLWSIATDRWKLIAAFVLCGIAIGAVLIWILPVQYRATTTVITVQSENPAATQTAARALANVIGVGLQQDNVREEALALLRSDRLAWEFLTTHELIPLITEGEEIREDNLRGVVVERFKNGILSVEDDRRTGLITVSMMWGDRRQAAEWTNAYVRLADDVLRNQTLKDSQTSLNLLEEELQKTNVIEIENAINRFYETQLQRMLFARARDAFALRTIDPAIVRAEDDIAAPNKPLILGSAFVLGALAGLIAAVMRETSARRGRSGALQH